MAATLMSALVSAVRHKLVAPASTDIFFDDAEILADLNRCVGDLQRKIDDLFEDYFLTIDRTNVTLAANATSLGGVPTDVRLIRKIMPRSLTTYPALKFTRRSYDHVDFEGARTLSAQDPGSASVVYYAIVGEGAGIAAPTIDVAPALSSALDIELVYVPLLANRASGQGNPIPGQSDLALIAWGMAYGRGREREDRLPDPGWLKIYQTESENIILSMAPRDTSEPQVAEGLFEAEWE